MKENKLIAEFMNMKYSDKRSFNNGEWTYSIESLNKFKTWDWLMPVVQKIESLGYVFTIQGGKAEFGEMISKPQCFTSKDKLSSTYDAVVEFIKQYNKES